MGERLAIPTSKPGLEVVVTDDGSRTLRRVGTRTTWHSEAGAVAESWLVYLQNSGFLDRCREGLGTRVLEIGFGTGLNFWLAGSVAQKSGSPLQYVSLESSLLDHGIVNQLQHGQLPECQPCYDQFLERIYLELEHRSSESEHRSSELETVDSVEIQIGEVQFKLILSDALKLEELIRDEQVPSGLDIVFHDPFSPVDAPAFWTRDYLERLCGLLDEGGCLVTFCVKSSVQRMLREFGLAIQKTPGPPNGKREVLIARKT